MSPRFEDYIFTAKLGVINEETNKLYKVWSKKQLIVLTKLRNWHKKLNKKLDLCDAWKIENIQQSYSQEGGV